MQKGQPKKIVINKSEATKHEKQIIKSYLLSQNKILFMEIYNFEISIELKDFLLFNYRQSYGKEKNK